MLCWGANGNGALGDGTTTIRLSPVPIAGSIGGMELVAPNTGFMNGACGLRQSSSEAYCWGWNPMGQVGNGTTAAVVLVPTLSEAFGARVIVAGGYHTCTVDPLGGMSCWGLAGSGQLGNDSTTSYYTRPQAVRLGANNAVQASLGVGFTCATRATGEISCWGTNTRGQLGTGTSLSASVPTNVVGVTDGLEVAAGGEFACARTARGVVLCWGRNMEGQLGDGTTTDSPLPVYAIGRP